METELEFMLLFSLLARSRSTRRCKSAMLTTGVLDNPLSPGVLAWPGKEAALAMAEYCGGP